MVTKTDTLIPSKYLSPESDVKTLNMETQEDAKEELNQDL